MWFCLFVCAVLCCAVLCCVVLHGAVPMFYLCSPTHIGSAYTVQTADRTTKTTKTTEAVSALSALSALPAPSPRTRFASGQ